MSADRSSAHTRPDSLFGALVAFEGIQGATAIVNAPTGCKFGVSYLVDQQDPRDSSGNPLEHEEEFFFGQRRIPCTYLDEMDYVKGSAPKLTKLLQQLEQKGAQLIGIVNGPGTSLIGDDLRAIADASGVHAPTVGIETAGINGSASLGFSRAMTGILNVLEKKEEKTHSLQKTVAICGLSLLSLRWADNLRQLRDELALGGLTSVMSMGAGATLEELAAARSAQVIACVDEAFGWDVAQKLALGRTCKLLPNTLLAPVGLQASEQWLSAVIQAAGGDIEPVRQRVESVRGTLYRALSRFNTRTALPKGLAYVVAADACIAAPLLLFLTDHLGMLPAGLLLRERAPEAERFIKAFMRARSLSFEILRDGSPLDEAEWIDRLQPEIVFGSSYDRAITTQQLKRNVPFVPVAYPHFGHIHFTHRPLMGLGGTLVLCEDILNALHSLTRTALV